MIVDKKMSDHLILSNQNKNMLILKRKWERQLLLLFQNESKRLKLKSLIEKSLRELQAVLTIEQNRQSTQSPFLHKQTSKSLNSILTEPDSPHMLSELLMRSSLLPFPSTLNTTMTPLKYIKFHKHQLQISRISTTTSTKELADTRSSKNYLTMWWKCRRRLKKESFRLTSKFMGWLRR